MDFSSEEAAVIFESHSGTIYTIDSGVVVAIEKLSVMEVGIFTNIAHNDGDLHSNNPCGYIQVDELLYPVVLGNSHVFGGCLNDRILFMFKSSLESADVITAVSVSSEEAETLVGILTKLDVFGVVTLTKKSTSDVDAIFGKRGVIYQPSGPVDPTIESISRGMVSGAFAFSSLASKGASFCQSALEKVGQKAFSDMKQSSVQRFSMNPHLRRTLYCANLATKSLAVLTSAIVRKTSKVSAHVLKKLVKKGQSSVVIKRLPRKWKDSVFLLGSSALVSSGIAIHGMETAVCAVGRSVVNVASSAVKANHGIEAGTATANALNAAGSTALVWHNLSNFSIRSFAERGAQLTILNEKDNEEIKVGDCIAISC